MVDLFKKAFYFGVGAAVLTKEKVEELVDDLVKRGEASQADKPKLMEEFMAKAREQEKELTAKVKSIVQKSLSEMGLSTRNDIEDLKKRLDKLEKNLASKSK